MPRPHRAPRRTLVLVTVALALGGLGDAVTPRAAASPALTSLSSPAQSLVTASLDQGDALWDPAVALLWGQSGSGAKRQHTVRASAWYALGLMLRDAPGDRARSLRTFDAVMAQQYDASAAEWDGSFKRTAEEDPPPAQARMWRDYDPNWRQFIGTVLSLVLAEYGDRIPAPQQARMLASIRRAVDGELKQQRLVPTYTNIALMHGYLLADAGRRLDRPAWVRDAETWLETVHAGFTRHGTFDEFNSPTYYGVDLYALALLRAHGATPRLRELGADMEAALWRDIAQFYHAGLRNLCGPFDRAYGMDMTRYVSLVGVWLALELPPDQAPLPPVSAQMAHGLDFFFTPCFALLGVRIPADVRPALTQFTGERVMRREIGETPRVATSWLGHAVMLGGESTGHERAVAGPDAQFHPATVHWRTPAGSIGCVALTQSPPVDATASANRLSLSTRGDCTFTITCAGATRAGVEPAAWHLPGLDVRVDTDARSSATEATGGTLKITYHGATRIVLETATP